VSDKTKAVLKIDSVTNSKVVGVQYGLDEERMKQLLKEVLKEEMHDLRTAPHGSLPTIDAPDTLLDSLFVCASDQAETMGFAVNNTGLLIAPSAAGDIKAVRNVKNPQQSPARTIERYSLLQTIKIETKTRGLVPAYLIDDTPQADAPFLFDSHGCRRELKIVGMLRWVRLKRADPQHKEEVLTNLLLTTLHSSNDLVGGPVFTGSNEVMGIAVASSMRALVVRPWSTLSDCIKMSTEHTPATPSSYVASKQRD
jgi:hypothetical protein